MLDLLRFEIQKDIADRIEVAKSLEVIFLSHVSNFTLLEFISLQDSIRINPGETGLAFFRIYNPTTFSLSGVSIYFVYPSNISVYVHKIQCFCFDIVNIKSRETVELPILFFIDKLFLFDNIIFENTIYISYVFFIQ